MLNRIFAICYKDLKWAIYNPKLLMLILMPLMLSVFFQFTAKGAFLGFSFIFSYTFVGCFLCSYLIVEEKKIDSLKSLLITPLSFYEIAVGKFLFPLAICVLISFFIIGLAQKWHLLLNPFSMLAIVLMSSTICLFGLFLGLLVKNEQELGILGPVFMVIFLAGVVQTKETNLKLAGYFPEFHLTHLIDNIDLLTWQQSLIHVIYLFILFFLSLLLTSTFLKYFFTTDLDSKRINIKTLVAIVPVLIFLGISGATAEQFAFKDTTTDNVKKTHSFKKTHLEVTVAIDDQQWDLSFVRSDEFDLLTLKDRKSSDKMTVGLRSLDKDEMDLESRLNKISNKKTQLISVNTAAQDLPGFVHVITLSDPMEYRTSYSQQCENELLVFAFYHPMEQQKYKKLQTEFIKFVKASKVECSTQK